MRTKLMVAAIMVACVASPAHAQATPEPPYQYHPAGEVEWQPWQWVYYSDYGWLRVPDPIWCNTNGTQCTMTDDPHAPKFTVSGPAAE